MNMRVSPEYPSEIAQLRAIVGVQAMAIEALTRRLTALEVSLADVQRAAPGTTAAPLEIGDTPPLRRASMAEIAAAVHVKTGIMPSDLRGRSRLRPYTYARMIFCAIARRAGYSTQQIGDWLGGRDHTTVMEASRCEGKALAYFDAMRSESDEVIK